MGILIEISENLQAGDANKVKELVQKAVDEGLDTKTILEDGLIHGMNIIGDKFKRDEIYVPEVLIAARALKFGSEILKPLLISDGVKATGKVILGTVAGDLHDIGKNLVKMMMEGKGLEVVDLGVDVPAERFIEAAINENAQVIACSALLTTTMHEFRNIIDMAAKAEIRDKIVLMIGGAPVSEEYRLKVGADIYTSDAASAADAAVAACAVRQ
jgi:corrinoid protein of di/trimethylamine methyltransferase